MKVSIIKMAAALILIALFNVLFFVLGGTDHPLSVWIAYGFIHFAYFMFILTPLWASKGRDKAIFGFTIAPVSLIYLIVETIIGVVFLCVAMETYLASLLTQLVFAGVYLVFFFIIVASNKSTADSVKRQQVEVRYIKDSASRIKTVGTMVTDAKAQRAIEGVYDLMHSSPSRSSKSVLNVESEIAEKVSLLEQSVDNTDDVIKICRDLTLLINERNRVLMIENH